jgi:predicted DNA-binding transcriptional regulator AlpA
MEPQIQASPTLGGAELLTLREVAALCGVSQRTVWGWAESGISPPPLKIGKGTVRYSRRAYEQWIAAGCAPCNGGQANA